MSGNSRSDKVTKAIERRVVSLVVPTLSAGGMEKIIYLLSKYGSRQKDLWVHIILMTRSTIFFDIPDGVRVHQPPFDYLNGSRWISLLRTFKYLRSRLKDSKSTALLSFGGRYNAFVILAALGLVDKVFVSDRSRPGISYGRLQDILNPILYRWAVGLIAQTEKARRVYQDRVGHPNIRVIPNPIERWDSEYTERENVILNVGRFIPTKQQALLIKFFIEINDPTWKLVLVGVGPEFENCKLLAEESALSSRIIFTGNIHNVNSYYGASKIFAFTSVSEGFPNALGEAMAAGLACISFDCVAGPADLIDHEMNGILIPEGETDHYRTRLKRLMQDNSAINRLGSAAKSSMARFDQEKIAAQYFDFICHDHET